MTGDARPERQDRPLAAAAVGIFVLVLLVFAGPPVVGFIGFLFAGNGWRALVGVALLLLTAGLAATALIGRFPPRHSKAAWTLAWTLIVLSPVCVLVAFIGSGWAGYIVSEARKIFG